MEEIRLRLPEETIAALHRIAWKEDVSLGQVVRDAIERDLRRRAMARKPVRADERIVAPLRALLADDLAYANNWPDLQARLAQKGFRLQAAGGGLALYRQRDNQRLCKSSELGYSYSRLLRRLRAPFPGHPHKEVLHRVEKELRGGEMQRSPAPPARGLPSPATFGYGHGPVQQSGLANV